jgi:hypothetical protein
VESDALVSEHIVLEPTVSPPAPAAMVPTSAQSEPVGTRARVAAPVHRGTLRWSHRAPSGHPSAGSDARAGPGAVHAARAGPGAARPDAHRTTAGKPKRANPS